MSVRPSACLSASRARYLCADYVTVGGSVLLSPNGRRQWRTDSILAASAFRPAGQRSAAAASKRHHFGHKIVLFCVYVLCLGTEFNSLRVH